jgi:hypothetical protein
MTITLVLNTIILRGYYKQVNEAFEVISIDMSPGGTGKMPNLMPVANTNKAKLWTGVTTVHGKQDIVAMPRGGFLLCGSE